MRLLTPCSIPKERFLYTMIVLGGRVFAPFKSCPEGEMVLNEIDDTCIRITIFRCQAGKGS